MDDQLTGLVRVGLLGVVLLALGACGPTTFVVGVGAGDRKLERTTVEDDGRFGSPRVAIIDVTGMITSVSKPGLLRPGKNPLSDLAEMLEEAGDDGRVAAVIVRLNTSGGAVTASDAMHRELQRFKAATGKPVVALMMDVAASGGYYVACAADTIVAHPTTVTGSIGVIVQTISIKPALDRWGIRAEALTSGPNKEAGSPLSVLTDEQRATLQELVDDFYQRFVDVVKQARPNIPADRLGEVTDGRVYSGEDALAAGLVDELGDLHTAFDAAKRLAQVDSADLVIYHRPLEHVGSPYAHSGSASGGGGPQVNLLQLNVDAVGGLDAPVGFYYLWRPDLP